jgi:hypothetical protein
MATLQRVHGGAAAGAFYGYQPLFIKLTGTNLGTADTVIGAGLAGAGNVSATGNFTKSIVAIQQVGSIVFIGPRADGGFVVAVDSATANAGTVTGTAAEVAANVGVLVAAATGVATTALLVTLTAAGVTA